MKISLVGVGRVGSTLAYTLVSRGLGEELVLVDQNRRAAEGEALDLAHVEIVGNRACGNRVVDLIAAMRQVHGGRRRRGVAKGRRAVAGKPTFQVTQQGRFRIICGGVKPCERA